MTSKGNFAATFLAVLLLPAMSTFATVYYVDLNSPSPTPPYTNWSTAATNIQDAVDTTSAGDEVLVADGVYQYGGRVVVGMMNNRLAITKPITVRSVNGPTTTIINGQGSFTRCVYVTNEATLVGFTLINGVTRQGGVGDPDRNETGGGAWCESPSAVLSNCVVVGNVAGLAGGGVKGGTLISCVISNNRTLYFGGSSGGGASECALQFCSLNDNYSYGSGGAVSLSTLDNCLLARNGAAFGGGASYNSTLIACTVVGNSASSGGGASGGTLDSCELSSNSADSGGAAWQAVLANCTLTGNSAGQGGGAYGGTLNNCILYYNFSPTGENYSGSIMNYCCTTPLPVAGIGNISADPQLASKSHLSVGSPCVGAGSVAYATLTDIDGEAWSDPPSIGCDEYHAGIAGGVLTVGINAGYTNVAAGYTVKLIAEVGGKATTCRWALGDGTIISNQPYVFHAWSAPGEYGVSLTVYNDTNPDGVAATNFIHVEAPYHYVSIDSGNPMAPYSSWITAATNIQAAVDVSSAGSIILVSNGVYKFGGTNAQGTRVAATNPVRLESVNGPSTTAIDGTAEVGCIFLGKGAVLIGFTLTNGYAWDGGGVLAESTEAVLTNCVIIGNSAYSEGGGVFGGTLYNCIIASNYVESTGGGGAAESKLINCTLTGNQMPWEAGGGAYMCLLSACTLSNNFGAWGGGADNCTLDNCLLVDNYSDDQGGGANESVLRNCTVVGNTSSSEGGGVADSTLYNCIVWENAAPNAGNYAGGDFYNCCTTPIPESGSGNFTNSPLFLDQAGSNFRLGTNSPDINAGINTAVAGSTDLDGMPRIVGGTVDIGAYEFQLPGSVLSYAWAQQYGLPTDGSVDYADTDGDGMNNWKEWKSDTVPTNSLSYLGLVGVSNSPAGLNVSWQSVATRSYFLERATNLADISPFISRASNIAGQSGVTSFTDTTATNDSPYFYRVGVQP